MGRDRTSVIQVGKFELAVDKDHRGYYRGKQALIEGKYHGWHYHVEHEDLSQLEIMDLLELELRDMGATRIFPDVLGIGVVEHTPATCSCWELGNRTCVLWVSGFNGKLHVETNKDEPYKYGIFTKDKLIEVLRKVSRA